MIGTANMDYRSFELNFEVNAIVYDKPFAEKMRRIFFDDLSEPDFATAFSIQQSVGDHFLSAYIPIFERRIHTPFGDQERDFQLYRRGRYVEFNLVVDRGTIFGLQSNGRSESILMSMPPLVKWRYNWQPEKGTTEAQLYEAFLIPKNWV